MAELPVVDDEERERLRAAFKRYKKQHGRIGDPALLERIKYKLPHYEGSLSTLQRFMRGRHRTDDYDVRRYREFLQQVAPPPVGDKLGEALAKFLAPDDDDDGALKALPGVYSTTIRPWIGTSTAAGIQPKAVLGPLALNAIKDAAAKQPWSRLTISESASRRFMHVAESIAGVPDTGTFGMGGTGIIAHTGGNSFVVMMRSFLNRRAYHLVRGDDGAIAFRGAAVMGTGKIELALASKPGPNVFEFEMTREG